MSDTPHKTAPSARTHLEVQAAAAHDALHGLDASYRLCRAG